MDEPVGFTIIHANNFKQQIKHKSSFQKQHNICNPF